jgi:hypothetical protein
MNDPRFKVGQRVRVNSAFSPSLLGRITEEPKYIEKAGEFEYLIQTEKHTDLGELGNICFFESELSSIEDQTTDPTLNKIN